MTTRFTIRTCKADSNSFTLTALASMTRNALRDELALTAEEEDAVIAALCRRLELRFRQAMRKTQ